MDMFFEIVYSVVDIVNFILAYRFIFGEKLKKDVIRYVFVFSGIIILQWVNISFIGIEKDFLDLMYGFGVILFLGEGNILKRIIILFDSYAVSAIFISSIDYIICFLLKKDEQQMIQNLVYSMMLNSTFLLIVIVYLPTISNRNSMSVHVITVPVLWISPFQ